jgi:CDP-ribitol ribitolphosphotransferase
MKKMITYTLRFCLLRLIWPVLYRLGCLRPVNPRLILFASELEESPSDNFLPLMEQLGAEGFDCRFFGRRREAKWRRYLRTCRFFFTYAQARVLYLDETFSPANACPHRKGTHLVQLWHGCGAFKKWGYSTLDASWGPGKRLIWWFPAHLHYTFACVSCAEVIPAYAEAFRCAPELLRPWGAPRTDFYFQPDAVQNSRKAVLAAFPDVGARKILLYAPTFRGDHILEARHENRLDLDAMARALGRDCVLLQKPHPKISLPLSCPEEQGRRFVFDARALPIAQLLCAADLVITDYSSLIFEYALLARPMLFFAFDLEEYKACRSFYYPYETFIPGDLVLDADEIIRAVRRNLFEDGFDHARVESFCTRFMSACDGHSTQRIIQNTII